MFGAFAEGSEILRLMPHSTKTKLQHMSGRATSSRSAVFVARRLVHGTMSRLFHRFGALVHGSFSDRGLGGLQSQ